MRAAGKRALAPLIAVAALASLPAAADATSVSTNWAGYAALPSASTHTFSSVSGIWTEPSATCTTGQQSYSAVWVGLGGYKQDAQALEQIGTDADCASSGKVTYSSWYELIPAGPVNLKITVHPGDQLAASVTVRAHDVTLRLSDLTSGQHVSITRHVKQLDTSSAEWIVEAPSVCQTTQLCSTLSLADFGSVAFSAATATAYGHVGTITDPSWTSTELELRQSPLGAGPGHLRGRTLQAAALVSATPSSPPGANGAFSVSWQEAAASSEEQPGGQTLPGFSGGPP